MGFRRNIAIVIALVAAFGLFLVGAQAREQGKDAKTNCKDTATTRCITITQKTAQSTFYTAVFNFDSTKGTANEAHYAGDGSAGKFTGTGISQSAPDGKSCAVADGSNTGLELALVGHVANTRFEDGDMLFERGDAGDLIACLDLAHGTFHETGNVKIVGGTGKYAGASGTEAVVQDGGLLSGGEGGKYAFGFSQGHFDATFTVPK